jgi:flotillin
VPELAPGNAAAGAGDGRDPAAAERPALKPGAARHDPAVAVARNDRRAHLVRAALGDQRGLRGACERGGEGGGDHGRSDDWKRLGFAEKLPEIVAAAAESFKHVDNLTVLNGAQGISEIVSQVIGQAGPALRIAQEALGRTNGDQPSGRSEKSTVPDSQR